jgi:hypothetical protein
MVTPDKTSPLTVPDMLNEEEDPDEDLPPPPPHPTKSVMIDKTMIDRNMLRN